eukprot:8395618-Karenia_brevis.AAC.1
MVAEPVVGGVPGACLNPLRCGGLLAQPLFHGRKHAATTIFDFMHVTTSISISDMFLVQEKWHSLLFEA